MRGTALVGESSAFPLAFGLVPPERIEGVARHVKSRGMACSVYGAQYLLEALCAAGEPEYALFCYGHR